MSQLLFFITVSVAHLLDAYKKQSVRSWAVVCLVVQQFFEFLFEVFIRTNAYHVAKHGSESTTLEHISECIRHRISATKRTDTACR